MSSWDEYIAEDLVNSGHFRGGAIVGHDGAIWASSEGLKIEENEATEIADILSSLSSRSRDAMLELKLHGKHFVVLYFTNDSLFAKNGFDGIMIMKTKQTYLMGKYDEQQQPSEAYLVMEKLAKYLIEMDY